MNEQVDVTERQSNSKDRDFPILSPLPEGEG